MKKTARKILIVVLTIVTISAIFTIPALIKVTRTGIKLSAISTEIAGITENANNAKPGYGWSKDRIAQYNKCQAERKALYNSSDRLVNVIANSNNLVRLLIFTALIVAIMLQFASAKLIIPYYYRKIRRSVIK